MRFGVAIGLALVLAACGGPAEAPKPAEPAAPVAAEPVELGQTESTIDCPLEKAIYGEPQAGWELRFREGKPWEMIGMTDAIMELVGKDGTVLWGEIASNMGTSRNGRLFLGCNRPGAEDDDLTEEQYTACRMWEGVVYSLNKGEPGYMTSEDGNAPERILLTDLGRKIRYSVVSGPGEEPWDVFTFKSCAL